MEEILEHRLIAQKAKALATFGWSFSAGMAILTAIGFWKQFPPLILAITSFLCLFHILAFLAFRKALLPTFTVVTFLGHILGTIISWSIFTVVYYLIFTPIAVLLRLCGKNLIGKLSLKPAWVIIPENRNDPERLRKLF